MARCPECGGLIEDEQEPSIRWPDDGTWLADPMSQLKPDVPLFDPKSGKPQFYLRKRDYGRDVRWYNATEDRFLDGRDGRCLDPAGNVKQEYVVQDPALEMHIEICHGKPHSGMWNRPELVR